MGKGRAYQQMQAFAAVLLKLCQEQLLALDEVLVARAVSML